MILEGDGPEGQPADSVDSLDALVEMQGEEDIDALDAEDGESEGDDEQEEGPEGGEDEDSGEESGSTVKLKHDGKEVEVPESELIPLAQQGLDYSKKTMALAEDRKAVEVERTQLREVRQQQERATGETLNRLHAFAAFAEQQVGQAPDVSLLHQDTASYLLAKEQHEARKGQFQQAVAAIEQVQNEQARQRQAWIVEQADATDAALRDTLPGWNDELMQSLTGYAQSLGLSPEALQDAFVTKGMWQALHKAKAYDDLLARKAQLKPKADLPRVEKPKAAANPSRTQLRQQKSMDRHRAKPSISSLAELMD